MSTFVRETYSKVKSTLNFGARFKNVEQVVATNKFVAVIAAVVAVKVVFIVAPTTVIATIIIVIVIAIVAAIVIAIAKAIDIVRFTSVFK